MTSFYPVFLNLEGRRCVIIGGGQIAEGKVLKLIDSGAKIVVISPDATKGIQDAAEHGDVELHLRKYQAGDLHGSFLVIAATNDRVVNQEIFEEADSQGILLNAVDDPPRCSFIAPAIVERGPVTLAISTGGASPALARKLRETLDDSPSLDWADATSVLSRARQIVKDRRAVVDPQRWQCCMNGRLLELAQTGHEDEALAQLLQELLGEDSAGKCSNIGECVSGGCQTRNANTGKASRGGRGATAKRDRMAETAGD
ncbi:MAG: bifunctional precorrin-2 dehydrogenase/sirohydrochlorin ferrochelatase [Chloroflexi bacterium]|nr:bifunctional precorrin-2 dehydrogenase/sirohydrochlorin ferrochelatase [Chloroflexota bacterium]MDA1270818.1 bifunctional precorrin-2 dehydrogenase/sirohydrochlorin ferrochelatase [Chloroflexota bacterium]